MSTGKWLFGPNPSSSSGGATFVPTAPTITKCASVGSSIYTSPNFVLFLRIRMVGGGGGGGGSGGAAGTAAGAGSQTVFGPATAFGGLAGAFGNGAGLAGGGATLGTNTTGFARQGNGSAGCGYQGSAQLHMVRLPGGNGSASPFGGAGGGGGYGTAGDAALANSGSGGGGGGLGDVADAYSGQGGTAGGYCDFFIVSPGSTYSFTVGAAGSNGAAGTSPAGSQGGQGGSGYIEITEYYQ